MKDHLRYKSAKKYKNYYFKWLKEKKTWPNYSKNEVGGFHTEKDSCDIFSMKNIKNIATIFQ